MKKPNQKDLVILTIVLFLGVIIGWLGSLVKNSFSEPIRVENPINEALKKRGDSLEAVTISRQLRIEELEKEVVYSDSVIVHNNKTFKTNSNEYKSLPDSLKHHYVDSVLKRAGKR